MSYLSKLESKLDKTLLNKVGIFVDQKITKDAQRSIRTTDIANEFKIQEIESLDYLSYFCYTGKLNLEKRFFDDAWGQWRPIEGADDVPAEEIENLRPDQIICIFWPNVKKKQNY